MRLWFAFAEKRKARVYARQCGKFKNALAMLSEFLLSCNYDEQKNRSRLIPVESRGHCGGLEFIAAVRQGLSELDNGDSVPLEDVERELPSWVSSSLTSTV